MQNLLDLQTLIIKIPAEFIFNSADFKQNTLAFLAEFISSADFMHKHFGNVAEFIHNSATQKKNIRERMQKKKYSRKEVISLINN